MSEVIVTMKHVRSARMCAREARSWVKRQGFDWNEFLTNGFPEHVLTDTGDPLALRAVEEARADPDVKYVN